MSDEMDFINKIKENNRQMFSKIIKCVKETAVPQNILAMKSISDDFITDDDNGYIRNGEAFFFTERLVNRLMHFAYLCGKDEAENRVHEHTQMLESTLNDVKNLVNSM